MPDFEELNQTNPEFLAAAQERATEIIAIGLGVVELTETILGAPLPETAELRDSTILPPDSVTSRAKEKAIRAALTEIGIGMTADRGLAEAGLSNDAVVLLEGGQRHKVVAETHLLGTGPVIFSGSPNRLIAGDERATVARIFELADEEIGETEYDMVYHVAQNLDGFEPLPEAVEVGKLTAEGNLGEDEVFGTLLHIGTIKEGMQPVYIFDVPRKYLFDEEGNPILNAREIQEFQQPSAGQQIVAFTRLLGHAEGAVATSSTYYPSRLGEIVRASFSALKQGQIVPKIDIVAYCPERLAKVKGEDEPAIPTLANMLGEAFTARKTFLNLHSEIAQSSSDITE